MAVHEHLLPAAEGKDEAGETTTEEAVSSSDAVIGGATGVS